MASRHPHLQNGRLSSLKDSRRRRVACIHLCQVRQAWQHPLSMLAERCRLLRIPSMQSVPRRLGHHKSTRFSLPVVFLLSLRYAQTATANSCSTPTTTLLIVSLRGRSQISGRTLRSRLHGPLAARRKKDLSSLGLVLELWPPLPLRTTNLPRQQRLMSKTLASGPERMLWRAIRLDCPASRNSIIEANQQLYLLLEPQPLGCQKRVAARAPGHHRRPPKHLTIHGRRS